MKNFLKVTASLCLFSASLAGIATVPAAARDKPVVLVGDVKLVKLVENPDGTIRTTLVAPEITVPGDRLVFSTAYSNRGEDPVTDLVVTNPLPRAVRLAPDADPAFVVSVDGGRSWGRLVELEVVLADGRTRPAEAADVTHVRWTLALVGPGESGRVEFPAIIR